MANPAPYFVEEKVIAVIDNKRVESYCPNFVHVLDMNVYGDVESTIYNTRTVALRDLAGHPEIDAYIAEMDAAVKDHEERMEAIYAKAGIKTYKVRVAELKDKLAHSN